MCLGLDVINYQDASGRTDIADFFTSVADLQRRLTRPRFARSAVLPEFRKESVCWGEKRR